MKKIILSIWLIIASFVFLNAKEEDKYLLLRDANSSNFEALYEYMNKHAPGEDAFVALLRIAAPHINKKDWTTAVSILELYKDNFPNQKENIVSIINILLAEEEGIEEENLGETINTKASEFTPFIRADLSQLYFTANKRGKGSRSEDVYVSNFDEETGWSEAMNLCVNTPRNEAAQCLTVDGNKLYVYGNYADNLGRGDLYEFSWDDSVWTDRTHLPYPINTRYFDGDANITADGNAIFFVSERPGGIGKTQWVSTIFHGSTFGNTDIYVSQKTENGWSKPINLGEAINTPFAERKPQLHADGKTLYFSSEGHAGLGRLDVFVSRRLSEDSWTEWSKPVNLGKEINGPGRDWGIHVVPKGDDAYFSSSDKSVNYGLSDLYKTKLPKFARPYPVVAIQGKVIDQNGKPLEAHIVWEDLGNERVISKITSNSEDGSFFFILPTGKIYGYHAEKNGYYPISKNLDLSKTNKYIKINETLTMVNIEDLLEGSVRINNIFFEYDKAILKPESFPELKRLIKILKGIPNIKVEISGHTDNIGSAEYNMKLSEARAQSVIDYLKENGLNDIEFIAKGYGKSMPEADNSTEEGRSQNRRVEFRIIKNE